MNEINFDCDRVIGIYFTPGFGGKFLGNCLALSDDMTFQHDLLVEMQLNGELEIDKKIKMLNKQLTSNLLSWNNLGMGDCHLFGISKNIKFPHHGIEKIKYNSNMIKLTNSQKYFFLTIHGNYELKQIINTWKNCKYIIFNDNILFSKLRNYRKDKFPFIWEMLKENDWDRDLLIYDGLLANSNDLLELSLDLLNKVKNKLKDKKFISKVNKKYETNKFEYLWNLYKENDWLNECPKSLREYINFPEEIKNVIEQKFDVNNKKTKKITKNINCVYVWDSNWYLSEEKFLYHVEKLYTIIGLKGYDKFKILNYYNNWIDALDELNKK